MYRARINVLGVHMIHINLNAGFYAHVEHSPTYAICIKYYETKKVNTISSTSSQLRIHNTDL